MPLLGGTSIHCFQTYGNAVFSLLLQGADGRRYNMEWQCSGSALVGCPAERLTCRDVCEQRAGCYHVLRRTAAACTCEGSRQGTTRDASISCHSWSEGNTVFGRHEDGHCHMDARRMLHADGPYGEVQAMQMFRSARFVSMNASPDGGSRPIGAADHASVGVPT